MATLPSSVTDRVEVVRLALAEALRERVIGDGAEEKQATIMLTPGPRWFTSERPIHRVHGDSSMFIGGMRALLLQSLHPLAMAGVAQHSDYRNDPWGRLQRTADFLAATSFGPEHIAQQAVDRVKAVHERVTGYAADGRPYAANDPHLLRWVHVAEVDSFLCAHQEYGSQPLTAEECDAYVEDMALIASKLGVPAPPRTVRGLRDQLAMFRHELQSTPESRDVAKYLLLEPPLPAVSRVPYSLIGAAAVAILPAWARTDLRLPYLPITEKVLLRPIGSLISSVIRWAITPNENNPAPSTTSRGDNV